MRCRTLTVVLTATIAGAALTGCAGPVNPGGQGTGPLDGASCAATLDGILTPEEVVFTEGATGTYVSNAPGTTVAFDREPRMDADGVRSWDLREGPTDVRATLTLTRPSDGLADYAIAAQLAWPALLTLLDVATHDGATELSAVGLTTDSAVPAEQRTELLYDAPVTILRAPIAVGDSWGGQATFRDARLAGIPNAGVEDWTFTVVDRADAVLPGGTRLRDVLAIEVETTRTLAVAAGRVANRETTTTLQLVAPCVGEVARAVGPDAALAEVSELRRLEP